MIRVGIDTGGTFTDSIVSTPDGVFAEKTPTTDDLITGITRGFDGVCDTAGITPSDIDFFSHGHTVATNALIEETGAKTAVVTTQGFRDILEIGEAYRDAELLYNPCGERHEPLVPRKYRYGVRERLDARGNVMQPIDRESVDQVIDALERDAIESVAVCFLHSYTNSVHEELFYERCADRLPEPSISLSARVSPEIQEYRRTATTVVDAYVKPVIDSYLATLRDELRERGVHVPINVMKSDGGVARPNVVGREPVSQVVSGPVSATKAAQFIGETLGISEIITLDLGGTSADTALITDGAPLEERYREIRGMKINGPFIKINTIGAGGGSIAWVTDELELRVGPRSAGANPGPVCYGLGEVRPTVTDADLVLGILNPRNFAGGQIELDVAAARQSIATQIADPLGLTVAQAALEIRDVVDSKLASALRVTSVEDGFDPTEFTIMGFGGAGPMHACNVSAMLESPRIVFPANPGLTAAFGNVTSDTKYNYVSSIVETVADADLDVLTEQTEQLVAAGNTELELSGIPPSERAFEVSIDAKYASQNHYLTIPIPRSDPRVPTIQFEPEMLRAVARSFRETHETRYGFSDDDHPIELGTIRVAAVGRMTPVSLSTSSADGGSPSELQMAQKGTRTVIVGANTQIAVPFYDWNALVAGVSLEGPAIVEVENATIWIPPTFGGTVDEYKNVIVEHQEV